MKYLVNCELLINFKIYTHFLCIMMTLASILFILMFSIVQGSLNPEDMPQNNLDNPIKSRSLMPLARGLPVPLNDGPMSDDPNAPVKTAQNNLDNPIKSRSMMPFARGVPASLNDAPMSDDPNPPVKTAQNNLDNPIKSRSMMPFARGVPASLNDAPMSDDPNPPVKPMTVFARGIHIPNNSPSDESSSGMKPALLARGILNTTPSGDTSTIFVSLGSSNLHSPSNSVNKNPTGNSVNRQVLGTNNPKPLGRPQGGNQGVPPRQPRVSQVPRVQKNINCSAETFHMINDCCKEQTGPLFKQDARYKCFISGDFIYSSAAIKDYMLNRLYSPFTNRLDIPNSKAVRAADFMFTECIFKAEGLLMLNPGTTGNANAVLNTQKISNYFRDATENVDAKPLVYSAVESCVSRVPALAASQKMDFNVLPYLLVQCIKREVLLSCTIPSIPQDILPRNKQGTFRVYAEFCQNKRNALRSCPIFTSPEISGD